MGLNTNSDCTIIVFDEGIPENYIEVTENVSLPKHTLNICRLINQEENNPRIISASYIDCIKKSYDVVRSEIKKKYGNFQIEVHAYSTQKSNILECYRIKNSEPNFSSLILCSPGHDLFRVRFPATKYFFISVGLLKDNNVIISSGPNNEIPPDLIIRENFLEKNYNHEFKNLRGTSFAVAYVANIAAKIYNNLKHRTSKEITSEMLHAGILLISEKYKSTFLINNENNILKEQDIFSFCLNHQKTLYRKLSLRLKRNKEKYSKLSIIANTVKLSNHWLPAPPMISFDDELSINGKLVASFSHIAIGESFDITLHIKGLTENITIASTGLEVVLIEDFPDLIKKPNDQLIVGISASHDASACLMLNGKIIYAIQQERLTRCKHDGLSSLNSDEAINYCLAAAGFKKEDVDLFAFNVQAATPEYVGLSQPINTNNFCSFDPYSDRALFVSHHLCHAFAAYSGSRFNSAQVIVADGSGGTTVGKPDLILKTILSMVFMMRNHSYMFFPLIILHLQVLFFLIVSLVLHLIYEVVLIH